MKFLLVRHAMTDWNKEDKTQGITDIPLNTEGVTHALRLSQFLAKYLTDTDTWSLYSSNL